MSQHINVCIYNSILYIKKCYNSILFVIIIIARRTMVSDRYPSPSDFNTFEITDSSIKGLMTFVRFCETYPPPPPPPASMITSVFISFVFYSISNSSGATKKCHRCTSRIAHLHTLFLDVCTKLCFIFAVYVKLSEVVCT